jgi:hypothetical protein
MRLTVPADLVSYPYEGIKEQNPDAVKQIANGVSTPTLVPTSYMWAKQRVS